MAGAWTKTGSKLVKFGGKVMTVGHALSCARKGFAGCTKAEMAAVGKVLVRTIEAGKRKR